MGPTAAAVGARQTKEVGSGPARAVRYDEIAEWYLPWVGNSPGLVFDPEVGVIPERLDGERWLDVACGAGRTSRELACRGADVVGIDLSDRLIELAREAEGGDRPAISYLVADVTEVTDWWDGTPFDGATCEMAMMDIDDLKGAVAATSRVLRPAGNLCLSMVHPCFPGSTAGLSSWPPDRGYGAEGYWTSTDHNPAGIRIRVGSSHRTLATYLNVLMDAGFVLERVYEPPAEVPTWLVLALSRRPSGGGEPG
jgi:2-polyprenyl-3-methyl-5-hydroxy-6-metoxy-1,4-benzoquinol methylase